MNSTNKAFWGIIILIIVAGGVLLWTHRPATNEGIVCTQEARQCPDGSYVGRSGPRCEFAACPPSVIPTGWKTTASTTQGISYAYPETLPTKYISTVDWPPVVNVSEKSFSCANAGKEMPVIGKVDVEGINGRTYCVAKISEGAAGSTYIQYTYSTEKANGTASVTFRLREVQCANYDDPQKTECTRERETFSINPIIDQIVGSIQFINN